MKKPQYVLITTQHRGVFAGYLKGKAGKTVTLLKARCAIYWTTECKGFLGLATKGPTSDARIGPAVEEIELRDVTSVSKVSDSARDAWEANKWSL